MVETVTEETIIVSNIADTSCELYQLANRPRNFYVLGSFGLVPSIALGIAISRQDPVVTISGDAAILYNLGSLATEAWCKRKNLLHLVIDNGASGATGYQPTATSVGVSIAGVAQSCGIDAQEVCDCETLRHSLIQAFTNPKPKVIVAKVNEPIPQKAPLLPYLGTEIRDRFMKALGRRYAVD